MTDEQIKQADLSTAIAALERQAGEKGDTFWLHVRAVCEAARRKEVVYVACCEDRHCDPEIAVFSRLQDAKQHCIDFMAENMAHEEDITEEEFEGYEFYLSYGEESDKAYVVACTVDEE